LGLERTKNERLNQIRKNGSALQFLHKTTEVISVVCSRKVVVGASVWCTFYRLSPGISGEGDRMKVVPILG